MAAASAAHVWQASDSPGTQVIPHAAKSVDSTRSGNYLMLSLLGSPVCKVSR